MYVISPEFDAFDEGTYKGGSALNKNTAAIDWHGRDYCMTSF